MFEIFGNLQRLWALCLKRGIGLSDQAHQMWEVLVMSLLLCNRSGKLTHKRMVDVSALIDNNCQQLSNLSMSQVLVNVLSIKFGKNRFPKLFVLKIQLCSIDGNRTKCQSILNCKHVDIFDSNGNDNRVHSIIDFDFVFTNVLEDVADMIIDEKLDIVLEMKIEVL